MLMPIGSPALALLAWLGRQPFDPGRGRGFVAVAGFQARFLMQPYDRAEPDEPGWLGRAGAGQS